MLKNAHTGRSLKDSTNRGDWHVAHTSLGMGDYVGTGVRNPQGLKRGFTDAYENPERLKIPPKKLA